MMPSRRRRKTQGGFALLLVFAMAAAAVVMMYLELPRVAFENMRNKEETLVERGEQYQRAIQLYFRKNNKYPQTLEDLETTNNLRFLRKRYRDPMTGEEEWRQIHIDNLGQYTDSLVHKKEEEKKKTTSVLASNIQGIGESAEYVPNSGQQSAQNPFATARRPSEIRAQQNSGATGDNLRDSLPTDSGPLPVDGQQNPQNQQQFQPGQAPSDNVQPPQSGTLPATPGSEIRVQQAPPGFGTGNAFGSGGGFNQLPSNQGQGGNRLPNFPSQGANSQLGGQIGSPIGAGGGTAPPGLLTPRPGGQNPGGQSAGGQQGQQGGGFGFGGGFGSGGFGNSGGSTTPAAGQQQSNQGGFGGSFGNSSFGGSSQPGQGAPNQAIQAIRGILSGGRPNPQQGAGGTGAGVQGGIAGFASKRDMQAIKVYKERTNYKEWEFLFDMKKEQEARGKKANPGTPQLGGPDGNRQGMSPGTSGQGPTSGFGGFGPSSGNKPAPGGFGSGGSFGRQ